MNGQQTASRSWLGELPKARARIPLIALLALLVPPLAAVRNVSVWVVYLLFSLLYAWWALRLTRAYASDGRLGLLLCLTDTAILLPLLVWSDAPGLRAVLILVCLAGWGVSLLARRAGRVEQRVHRRSRRLTGVAEPEVVDGARGRAESGLERAVRERLGLFARTGKRFAVVVLRVLRFEEAVDYYGSEAAERIIHAVARRGLRSLGPDAQHFFLSGGRVAFLFETSPEDGLSRGRQDGLPGWVDPYDVEGLAMSLGRKACEHLIDGHRVECTVGWASAPADGLEADDLLYVAEAGAQSTEAFRRVGTLVRPRERSRAAAG